MNQQDFSALVRNIISQRLVEYLGEYNMDTTKPHLERISHAQSFYDLIMSKLGLITDFNCAGYKLDDSWEYRGINPQTDRKRLLKNLQESLDVVKFIAVTFQW